MIDSCLYYKTSRILIIYTDDCIMAAERSKEIGKAVTELAAKFEIMDKGGIDEYLGLR